MSKLRRKVKLRQNFASFFSANSRRRMLKASPEEAFKVREVQRDLRPFHAPDGRA
jgi:hypothetical protein